MRIRTFVLPLLLSLSAIAANVRNYALDLDGPDKLHTWSPHPSRVDIYVAGPRLGFDPSFTWLILHSKVPDYSTTNRSEISTLISALDKVDIDARIENISLTEGYTYHLLLFQDTNRTVMHFRVFEPMERKTNLYAIYPVAHAHNLYINDSIGPWLNARINISTNATVEASVTNTSQKANAPITPATQTNSQSTPSGSSEAVR